jgi:hypothetical protein
MDAKKPDKPHWLPEKLSIQDIVRYWSPTDGRQARIFSEEIQRDCIDGQLKCEGDPTPRTYRVSRYSDWMRRHWEDTIHKSGLDAKIQKDDFCLWLKQKGAWPLPESIPLSAWYPKVMNRTEETDVFTGELIAKAKSLIPKVKELWKMILDVNKPLKTATIDTLMKTAIEVLGDNPRKWEPITAKHVSNRKIYNTAPDSAGPTFLRNLLKLLLEDHGFDVPNVKQLWKELSKRS